MKIIVFEDDQNFISLLQRELALRQLDIGFDVYSTSDSAKRCQLNNEDVLLLDYYAPDGNFHDAVGDFKGDIIAISTMESKNIRAQELFDKVKIIAKQPNSLEQSVDLIVDELVGKL